MSKLRRLVFLAAVFFTAGNLLSAQEPPAAGDRWYLSNSAGMTLGETPSRLAALRNEYCISIQNARYAQLPARLAPHYDSSFSIELRTLYHRGIETRRQWIFRDRWGLVRLNASGSGTLFGGISAGSNPAGTNPEASGEEKTEEPASGFIEIRNSEGNITTEFQFEEDLSELEYRYFYREDALLRTEVWRKEAAALPAALPAPPPEAEPVSEEDRALDTTEENTRQDETAARENREQAAPAADVPARFYTDYYRYTRSGSLRAIDRTVHGGTPEKLRAAFPRLGPGAPSGEEIESQASAYTSEFFAGAENQTREEDTKITYNLDSRGRILGEVWKDESGAVIGELTNTWSGERLASVLWKTPNDERRIEFEYDREGNRVSERNFRRGELERSVANQDGEEVEEIYMNGKLVLRAHWKNGIKTSEERILSSGGGNR